MYGAVSAAAGIATEFICRTLTKCNTLSRFWQGVISTFLVVILIFMYYGNSQYPLMTVLPLIICYMGGGIRKKMPVMEAIGKFIGLGVLYVPALLTAECLSDMWKE